MADTTDEFGGETVYVKETSNGYTERIAYTPADHVNLRARGWAVKGSKGAPRGKVAPRTSEADSNESAASIRAHAEGQGKNK